MERDRNALTHHIKRQVENLLRIIDLEENGEAVQVDEIRIGTTGDALRSLNDDSGLSPDNKPNAKIVYEKLSAFRAAEPRLVMIAHFLESLFPFVEFRAGGRSVAVDGFRLKNLNYWAQYPFANILDNLGELCSACDSDCEICFLKGSAVDYPRKAMLTPKETRTRIKYFLPENTTGLPLGAGKPGEPFLNPHALDILRAMRGMHPDVPIKITTNGNQLTRETIRALADLKPVTIVLSLNSADPDLRRRIMGTRRADKGIAAIPMLREHDIQFIGSIVAPASQPISDIERTIRYLDRYDALQIRLLLPGFTRFHDPSLYFDTENRWGEMVRLFERLRKEIPTPFLVSPSYFWNQDIRALVDGVYRHSAAAEAGIQFGDLITEVDGQRVITKAEAAYFLARSPEEGNGGENRKSLKIRRGDETFKATLVDDSRTEDDRYPYKPRGYPPAAGFKEQNFGIHLIDGFSIDAFTEIEEIVDRHPDARSVLLFTTPLAQPLFAQGAMITDTFQSFKERGVELRLTQAEHRFWGGNIMIGDLHVVQDYIDHLTGLGEIGYAPDLTVIPRSFVGEWGFDVMGRSYRDIERITGCSVELIHNRRAMI